MAFRVTEIHMLFGGHDVAMEPLPLEGRGRDVARSSALALPEADVHSEETAQGLTWVNAALHGVHPSG
jgi:hypothetical protein